MIGSKTIKIPIQKAKAKSDTNDNTIIVLIVVWMSSSLLSDPLRRCRIELCTSQGYFGELRNLIRQQKIKSAVWYVSFLNDFLVGRWVRWVSAVGKLVGELRDEGDEGGTRWLERKKK